MPSNPNIGKNIFAPTPTDLLTLKGLKSRNLSHVLPASPKTVIKAVACCELITGYLNSITYLVKIGLPELCAILGLAPTGITELFE
ncbi:hypothetical protein D3C85_1364370 [compost metagenome]